MPMSAAAMSGVRDNGHRWKFEISFNGQVKRLANADDLVVGDCAVIRDTVVKQVRAFLERRDVVIRLPAEDRMSIDMEIDDIEMCEDDPDELKVALAPLYDKFDYYRICVVG